MPIYDIVCECGYEGEAFCRCSELRDGKCKCPACGKHAPQNYEIKRINTGHTRDLRGEYQYSNQLWCNPTEVSVYRDGIARHGGDSSLIEDTGDVKYQNQSQKKRMKKAWSSWEREITGKSKSA